MPELQITINGHVLSLSQTIVFRIAILAYEFDLETEGLGADEMGKALAAQYLERIREIKALMLVGEKWMPE